MTDENERGERIINLSPVVLESFISGGPEYETSLPDDVQIEDIAIGGKPGASTGIFTPANEIVLNVSSAEWDDVRDADGRLPVIDVEITEQDTDSWLTDHEYRALLELVMCSDPWPTSSGKEALVKRYLDREAKRRGFDGWIEAYHDLRDPQALVFDPDVLEEVREEAPDVSPAEAYHNLITESITFDPPDSIPEKLHQQADPSDDDVEQPLSEADIDPDDLVDELETPVPDPDPDDAVTDHYHRNLAAIVEYLENAGVHVEGFGTAEEPWDDATAKLEVHVPPFGPNELREDGE